MAKMISDENINILIGVTGSVATIKLIELIDKMKLSFNSQNIETNLKIKVVMTKNSKHFISKEDIIQTLDDKTIEIYDDDDEWSQWKKMGDPVLHIELRKWADLLLIAPLDANTMSKISNGICDNLLTCIIRAWDISRPLLYCPAMNVHMYNHPLTKIQMQKLESFGYICIDSVEKKLACGDFGIGGMASVETIINRVVEIKNNKTNILS